MIQTGTWPDHILILHPQLVDPASVKKEILLSNEVDYFNQYERENDIRDLRDVLQSCNPKTLVSIVKITLENYKDVLMSMKKPSMVIVNLCDGTETDGYPGISVPILLEQQNFAFTGAGSDFFETTTSKPVLKDVF